MFPSGQSFEPSKNILPSTVEMRYFISMKKNIYFGIIGVGAVLAIIGFFPKGMSGFWGLLIAGITGTLYYLNVQNDKKVQERLEEEKGMFERGGESTAKPEDKKEGDESGK